MKGCPSWCVAESARPIPKLYKPRALNSPIRERSGALWKTVAARTYVNCKNITFPVTIASYYAVPSIRLASIPNDFLPTDRQSSSHNPRSPDPYAPQDNAPNTTSPSHLTPATLSYLECIFLVLSEGRELFCFLFDMSKSVPIGRARLFLDSYQHESTYPTVARAVRIVRILRKADSRSASNMTATKLSNPLKPPSPFLSSFFILITSADSSP